MRSSCFLLGLFIVGLIFIIIASVGIGFLIKPQEITYDQYTKDISMATMVMPTATSLPSSTPSLASTPTPPKTPTPQPMANWPPGIGSVTPTPTSLLLYGMPPTPTITPSIVIMPAPPISTNTQIPATITPFIIPDISVYVEWPKSLQISSSGNVIVRLIKRGEDYVITVENPGNTGVVSSPIPITTPVDEYSGSVEPYVTVSLVGGPHIIIKCVSPTPITSTNDAEAHCAEQKLGQSDLTWKWNISSENTPSYQIINLSVVVHWKTLDNSVEMIASRLWDHALGIEVTQPFINHGQLSLMSLVSGFIGSGLSAPWLMVQIRKKRAKIK